MQRRLPMSLPDPAVPPMSTEIEVQYGLPDGGWPSPGQIRAWAVAALPEWTSDDRGPAELVVRVVDEAEIRGLNRQYRHRDKPTNVLSFPCDAAVAGLLGDLVISAPVVEREAREQGKTLDAHFAHMVVHGVLHLLGYDHLNDADAAVMEARERVVLASLGYVDPY